MDSWRYSAEEKGFLFPDENDTDLSIDSFGRSRKLLTGWDVNSVESMEFVDLGFSEMPKKASCGGDRSLEMLGSVEIGIDPSKLELTSPSFMIASNSSLESGVNRSDSHDSSLIDLKLGRLADANSKRPASQAKKARGFGSRLQTPFCQVYGCQKDLSSLKDYHKRHKVCEVHSKTPRVIVNGLEQRFCQQCSRFHLLVEFDESKRSCRKRLAGHNERRRKPQFGGLSSRPYRLLQSYQGTEFLKASIQKKASMIFPHMLPGSLLYPEKCEEANLSRPVKLEEKSIYCAGGQFLPKSFLNLHGNDIQNTSGKFPRAAEDFSVLNATSSIHDIAGVSHSSCVHSLLSAESQDTSHSAGIIIGRPLTCQSINPHLTESSGKYTTNVFHSSGMNHFETDGFLQEHEANFLNAKYDVSAENGSTVSLLQLSSHLHRVEQQRNSAQVKHEIEDFSSFLPNYGT